jgi:hypothetical protein
MASSIGYRSTHRVMLSFLHLNLALFVALVRLIVVSDHGCDGCILFCLYQ